MAARRVPVRVGELRVPRPSGSRRGPDVDRMRERFRRLTAPLQPEREPEDAPPPPRASDEDSED